MSMRVLRTVLCAPLVLGAALLPAACTTQGSTPLSAFSTGTPVFVGRFDVSGAKAWAQAKATLATMSLKPLKVDDATMKALAEIEGADVTVECSTYDLNQSEVKVTAKTFLGSGDAVAKRVYDQIAADLAAKR